MYILWVFVDIKLFRTFFFLLDSFDVFKYLTGRVHVLYCPRIHRWYQKLSIKISGENSIYCIHTENLSVLFFYDIILKLQKHDSKLVYFDNAWLSKLIGWYGQSYVMKLQQTITFCIHWEYQSELFSWYQLFFLLWIQNKILLPVGYITFNMDLSL